MATLADVAALAETNKFVSIHLVMEHLGVSEEQACKALLACWQRGLLMPTTVSWFLKPVGGRPVNVRTSEGGKIARAAYYKPVIGEILKVMDEDPEKGFSIRDLLKIVDISDQQLRKVMAILVDTQEVFVGEASAGGSFGRKPKIYSRTEDGLDSRDEQFVEDQRKKKAVARAAKKGQVLDTSTGEIRSRPAHSSKPLKVDMPRDY